MLSRCCVAKVTVLLCCQGYSVVVLPRLQAELHEEGSTDHEGD